MRHVTESMPGTECITHTVAFSAAEIAEILRKEVCEQLGVSLERVIAHLHSTFPDGQVAVTIAVAPPPPA